MVKRGIKLLAWGIEGNGSGARIESVGLLGHLRRSKRKMKLLAMIAGAWLGAAAAAAPAVADPPFQWTGLYVGAHGGYGWSAFDGNMIYTDATPNDGFDASGKSIDGSGWLGGGQLGFNWQSGNVVFGIEADATWSGIKGDASLLPYPANAGSPAWDFTSRIDWLASVRARAGITSGRILYFITGGPAWAGAETNLDVVGPGYNAWGKKSETLSGWTVGGGLEWLLHPKWTFRMEYLYYRFNDAGGILPGMQMTSCNPACPHTTDGFGGDIDLHTARIGLNLKLN